MKHRDYRVLQLEVQVDQQIAAADERQLGKWGVSRHVVAGENTNVANMFGNLVAVTRFSEEAFQALFCDMALDIILVDAAACFLQHVVTEVSAKYLDA